MNGEPIKYSLAPPTAPGLYFLYQHNHHSGNAGKYTLVVEVIESWQEDRKGKLDFRKSYGNPAFVSAVENNCGANSKRTCYWAGPFFEPERPI